jgi:hypothetical protein
MLHVLLDSIVVKDVPLDRNLESRLAAQGSQAEFRD